MRCISPLLVRTSSRRDFVPCGKCNFCLQTKRADWTFRLQQEYKRASSAVFLTLTYDNEKIPISSEGLPELRKRDMQLFFKKLRKKNATISEAKVRHYSVGEYGTRTDRPHYHSILFNASGFVVADLHRIWTMGMIHVGTVTPASIHYVTKYVINRPGEYAGREPPFALMSKRPGIGSNYLETHTKYHREDMRNYVNVNGQKGRLPRYYKDKIFSEMERKRLAHEALSDGDLAYLEEVERLEKFHVDPSAYYDERIQHEHDSVKSKVNKLNKL